MRSRGLEVFWHFTNGWDLDCRQCHFSMSLFSCAEVFSTIVPFRPPLLRNLLRSSHFKKENKKISEKSERKSEKHVEVKTSGATINTYFASHINYIRPHHTFWSQNTRWMSISYVWRVWFFSNLIRNFSWMCEELCGFPFQIWKTQ